MFRFNYGDVVRVIKGEHRGFVGEVVASSEGHGIKVYTVKDGGEELAFVEEDLQHWGRDENNEVVEAVNEVFNAPALNEPINFDMTFATGINPKESKRRIRITKELLEDFKEGISRTDTYGMSAELVNAYENVCKAMRNAIETERKSV